MGFLELAAIRTFKQVSKNKLGLPGASDVAAGPGVFSFW